MTATARPGLLPAPGRILLILGLCTAAFLWFSGLAGLGLHAFALWQGGTEDGEGGLGLSSYTALIEGKPVAGLSDNLSGLTFSTATGTLFAVTNRPQEVVEISTGGELLRRIPLQGASDVEGITHVEGTRFIVADEGRDRLSWIEVDARTLAIDLATAPSLTLDRGGFDNMGFEGVSWDQKTETLMLAQEMLPVRVLAVQGLGPAAGRDGQDISLREWRPRMAAGHPVADLSSLTVHDGTGNVLLLSDLTSVLAEYSPQGAPVGLMPLWKGWHGLERGVPQAEGVAIGPDGDVYIVSEPNLLYRFGKDRPAAVPES